MIRILSVLIFLISMNAQAMPSELNAKVDPWAFGFGFGTESNYDSVSFIEIRSSQLFSFFKGTSHISLVVSYENKEISGIDREITPIHLLVEMSSGTYRGIVRSYVRIGGGAVLIDDTSIYPESNFYNTQFQVGADFITSMGATGMGSSFFVQVMMNSPAIRNPPIGSAEIYDGTTLSAGMRLFF